MDNSTIFSGSSRYANDFQQIIQRSVAIASLPLSQLNNQKATMEAQSAALSALKTKFTELATSVANLSSATQGGLRSSSLSDSSVASVTVGASASAATYTLEVIDMGAATLTMSADGLPAVADPASESISASGSFTLSVNGVNHTITPAANTLSSLAAAVNASGAGAQATVVNVGPPSAPDYRLSLRASSLGNVSVQLSDGSQDLLDTLSTGTSATYRVNGLPLDPIASDSRNVTLSPGLTAEFLAVGTTEIVVSEEASTIKDALSSLVTAYNTALAETDKHRGTNDGILSGQSLLFSLTASMRSISSYSIESGTVRSLADFGLNLDQNGLLSLDEDVLDEVSADDLMTFLGEASTNGFLKSAADALELLADSDDGLISVTIEAVKEQISGQEDLIAANEDRIQQMRESLMARMAAADALIATLEQQVSYMNGLFQAMRSSREPR